LDDEDFESFACDADGTSGIDAALVEGGFVARSSRKRGGV
jgi:hypothetical protein